MHYLPGAAATGTALLFFRTPRTLLWYQVVHKLLVKKETFKCLRVEMTRRSLAIQYTLYLTLQ